jgi:tetratricopeptide (TPR) repeat protein
MFLRQLLASRRVCVVPILLGLLAAGILLIPGVLLIPPQLRARYHLRAARSELEHFHNPQAVRHLQICLQVWPQDADVLLLAARAARCARAYDDAERCLDKYQQARGCDDAYSFEQLLLTAERHVDQVADLCWRNYVEKDHPETSRILDALTRGYFRQYRLVEARACLTRWLETQPESAQALCLEGQYYLDFVFSKNTALASYRRAVEIDPEHEEARLGLAVALLSTSDYAEAAKHLEFVRQRQPENLSVRVGLAECRYDRGDPDGALELVEQVLAQHPHHPPALELRGRLALAAGQFADAEDWLRQAVAGDPSNHNARFSLMQCLHKTHKDAEAQKLDEELKHQEDDLKRFNEIVTRELSQNPRDPALHYTLGTLLLRGGQRQEGLRWLRSALSLDPQYVPARQALDEYYQKAASKQPQEQ